MFTNFVFIFSVITLSLQDLVALESARVHTTISEDDVGSEDVKISAESAYKAVSPKVIEIGSDLGQIEAQIGLDDDPEVPGEPKVRISNSTCYGAVVLVILLLTPGVRLVKLFRIWKLLIFDFLLTSFDLGQITVRKYVLK